MPPFNTNLAIKTLMHTLLALWPAHPLRLTVPPHTHHLLRHRQLRINRARERMDQLWPMVVPQPEHRAAITAEGALGRAFLCLRRATVFDGCVFPVEA
jgi:hypothetical protein